MTVLGISKSAIDRAGRYLSQEREELTMEGLEYEDIFDRYRAAHLAPLTRLTLTIQDWLQRYGSPYYIAQRLKRKPQIARKLSRLSVRLSQLQDIGGLRIIVPNNSDVNKLVVFLNNELNSDDRFTIVRQTDYRELGRDTTGYRAIHIIISVNGLYAELQVRSNIQHYWAENIEKTSVIYGHLLKEGEGAREVLSYFKLLSDIFYKVESRVEVSSNEKMIFEEARIKAERTVLNDGRYKPKMGFVNEDIIKTMAESERSNPGAFNNWLLVFDWKEGVFQTWEKVNRDESDSAKKYAEYERQFLAKDGFEVVLIGSSDIKTVRQTHSHYFGISPPEGVLEGLDSSLAGLSSRMDVSVAGRRILSTLYRKHYWNTKSSSRETLKNHFCKGIVDFDNEMEALIERGLVQVRPLGAISLDIKKKQVIEGYL